MAEDPKLTAEPRAKLGSAECRRIRQQQRVPGNVYGHGEDPIAISVPEDAIVPVVHSGHKVVDLDLGGSTQKAMVREVQWDTFGSQLIHFDLQRVSADERVVTEVAIEVHGNAPGVLAGGLLELPLHTIRVECPALQIPERIVVNVNHLDIGQSVHVHELKVPEGVAVLNDDDEVVLHVVRPSVGPVVDEDLLGVAEPEVLKKASAEESNE